MRTETDAILDAMDEAFRIGRSSESPVVISHLKCAGIANWGRSGEVLHALEKARASQQVGCDCYPYAAGSSTLDLKQVDPRVKIEITWSTPFPEAAGRTLADIAAALEPHATRRRASVSSPPARSITASTSDDMRRILAHPATMIGSDGLPWDQHPHPRLWGAFPRVLGRYCRDQKLFSLPQAIHKMTAMPARRFGLAQRGAIAENYWADLVLFDPQTIVDTATFADPDPSRPGHRARLGQRRSVVHCSRTHRKPRRPLPSLAAQPSGSNDSRSHLPETGQPMIDPHSIFLLLSALGAVIGIILLVTVLKLNPFLSLLACISGARHRLRNADGRRHSLLRNRRRRTPSATSPSWSLSAPCSAR